MLADRGRWHGATVHYVVPELDSGPALIQGVVPVLDDDDVDTLSARVHAIEHRIYPMAVDWIARGRAFLDGDRVVLDGETLPAPVRIDGDDANDDA